MRLTGRSLVAAMSIEARGPAAGRHFTMTACADEVIE
jgi:hypothetical protein